MTQSKNFFKLFSTIKKKLVSKNGFSILIFYLKLKRIYVKMVETIEKPAILNINMHCHSIYICKHIGKTRSRSNFEYNNPGYEILISIILDNNPSEIESKCLTK